MKKTAAVVILIGVVLAFIGESRPIINKVHREEAHHNPQLQVDLVNDDPFGWTVVQIGLGLGRLIIAIGLGFFAREVPGIIDHKNIILAGNLGSVLAVLGALAHAIIRYYDLVRAPGEIFSNTSGTDWLYTTYAICTLLAIVITSYILFQTGYAKKLDVVIIVLSAVSPLKLLHSHKSFLMASIVGHLEADCPPFRIMRLVVAANLNI